MLSPSHVVESAAGAARLPLDQRLWPDREHNFQLLLPHPDGTSTALPQCRSDARSDTPTRTSSTTTLRPVADGTEGELFLGGAGSRRDTSTGRISPASASYRAPSTRRVSSDCTGPATAFGATRTATSNFLGRADRQVKINGKRVELDEIETCLRRSNLVGDAAVVCLANEPRGRSRSQPSSPRNAAGGAAEGSPWFPPAASCPIT